MTIIFQIKYKNNLLGYMPNKPISINTLDFCEYEEIEYNNQKFSDEETIYKKLIKILEDELKQLCKKDNIDFNTLSPLK